MEKERFAPGEEKNKGTATSGVLSLGTEIEGTELKVPAVSLERKERIKRTVFFGFLYLPFKEGARRKKAN